MASELATNAVLHTATGEKYGRMCASIEVLNGRAILCVLDQGVKAGQPVSVPRVKEQGLDGLCAGSRGCGWWTGSPSTGGGRANTASLELWATIPLGRDPLN